jgi:hypothetical protein
MRSLLKDLVSMFLLSKEEQTKRDSRRTFGVARMHAHVIHLHPQKKYSAKINKIKRIILRTYILAFSLPPLAPVSIRCLQNFWWHLRHTKPPK